MKKIINNFSEDKMKYEDKTILYYYLDASMDSEKVAEYGVKLAESLKKYGRWIYMFTAFNDDNVEERIDDMLFNIEHRTYSKIYVLNNSPYIEKFISGLETVSNLDVEVEMIIPDTKRLRLFDDKIINGYLS